MRKKLLFMFLISVLSCNVFSATQDEIYDSVEEQELVEEINNYNSQDPEFKSLLQRYDELETKKQKRIFKRSLTKADRKNLRKEKSGWPGPKLRCLYAGFASVVGAQGMICNGDNGKKYTVHLLGLGIGAHLSSGVVVIKTKADDFNRTYFFVTTGLYAGIGITSGVHLEDKVAMFGFGVGLGYDLTFNALKITEI